MSNVVAGLVRKLINYFGYEVVKTKVAGNSFQLGSWLNKFNIDTIIDIGANEGQFIQAINSVLPNKKIIAFEPIKKCYNNLIKNTIGLNITAYNFGLSDHNGNIDINISENFVSSSILSIENITTDLYPDSKYVNKEAISIKRLDDIISESRIEGNVLIKIDVQGYEDRVIAGGTETITNATIIIIEFSYVPLYREQWLFDEIYNSIKSLGFKFVGIADQILAKNSGMPLYGDAIFVKEKISLEC